jgi:hypothetical protein
MKVKQVQLLPEDGNVIARIPITDEVHCEMDLSSYHLLLELGYTNRLLYKQKKNRKYPCFRNGKTKEFIFVSRLLAGCKPNQACTYRDGDPMNLRLSNLRVA